MGQVVPFPDALQRSRRLHDLAFRAWLPTVGATDPAITQAAWDAYHKALKAVVEVEKRESRRD